MGVALGALLVVSGNVIPIEPPAEPPEAPAAAPTLSEPYEVFRGDPTRPRVALTFDCGPWVNPGYINGILDSLDDYGHRVTFFVTGEFLQKHGPLFASRMTRHEIANHSYSHPNFPRLPTERIRQEMRLTQEMAASLGATTLGMWRAPFGARTPRELWIAAEEGYPVHVMWSTDSGDWTARSAEYVRTTTLDGAVNGAVIVHHCNSWQTAAVLGSVLWQLREWGIGVVTVSEVMG
jgi:peptidoglycan-N-acetylglucosamine deacetylase